LILQNHEKKPTVNIYFIDLHEVHDDNNRSDFRDFGHTGPYAQKI